MAVKSEFRVVAAELKTIFSPYRRRLDVVSEDETGITLNTRVIMKNNHPMFFGAVRTGKAYVSFHLMPLYCFPDLISSMSPALKKRMQGKSCLNFTRVDRTLLKELKSLTKLGAARFMSKEFVNAVRTGSFGTAA